jgi:hypothetical protein
VVVGITNTRSGTGALVEATCGEVVAFFGWSATLIGDVVACGAEDVATVVDVVATGAEVVVVIAVVVDLMMTIGVSGIIRSEIVVVGEEMVLEAVLVAVEVEKVTLVGIITCVDDENCCGIGK